MFSLDAKTINLIIRETYPSYQATSLDDANLGFGFLFYAFMRLLRPEKILVIGSKAGFSVVSFALGLKDNAGTGVKRVNCYDTELTYSGGRRILYFIDPSHSEERVIPATGTGLGFGTIQNKWKIIGGSLELLITSAITK
jgi:hypothetical protein